MSEINSENLNDENKNFNINTSEDNFEKIKSREDFENNLLQSDNGQNQNQEEDELDNNLINYEINNEEDNYQNNKVMNSEEFNNENNKQENNQVNENDEEDNNNMEIGEENEQDDEIPLITLKDISLCQCCKSHFNKDENLPYLLKCGHFFCIKCINQYFKDEKGILCPSDGLVAKSIQELKLLKNFILNNDNEINNDNSNYIITNEDNNSLKISNDNKNNSLKIELENKNNNNKSCSIHKGQKLSHINCENNKLLCIYCAYELLKNNPKSEIKEIKEKMEEYNKNIKNMIDNTNNNLEKNKNYLKNVQKIKDDEIKKITIFYKKMIDFLINKEKDYKDNINSVYENTIKKIDKNIKIFNEIIEKANKCNNLIKKLSNDEYLIFDIMKNYDNLYNLYNSKKNIDKFEYIIFKYDNEKEVLNYLNNITEKEIKNEFLNYEINEFKNINALNRNDLNYELNQFNYLNKNNEINALNINLDKYNFPININNLKKTNITNNYSNYECLNNFNNKYSIDTKYSTLPLKNRNDFINNNFSGNLGNMPIHNSYLFHRNAYKDDIFLKEKLYEKYNSFNNSKKFYKTDTQNLINNKY